MMSAFEPVRTPTSSFAKSLWIPVFLSIIPSALSYGNVVLEDFSGRYGFYLIYNSNGYTLADAVRECERRSSRLAADPVPVPILNSVIINTVQSSVWIASQNGECFGLQRSCREFFDSDYGRRCDDWLLGPQPVSCNDSYERILCRSDPFTIPTPASTLKRTSAATGTTTTSTTVPTTATTSTTLASIDRSYSPKREESTTSKRDSYHRTGLLQVRQSFINGTANLLLGVTIADSKLLGLILAIVFGAFFTPTLVIAGFYFCCSKVGFNRKRYELVHGLSNNTIPYNAGDRGFGSSRSGRDIELSGGDHQPNEHHHKKTLLPRKTSGPIPENFPHSPPLRIPEPTEEIYVNSRFIPGCVPITKKPTLDRQIMSYEALPPPPPPPPPPSELPVLEDRPLPVNELPPPPECPYDTPRTRGLPQLGDILPNADSDALACSGGALSAGSINGSNSPSIHRSHHLRNEKDSFLATAAQPSDCGASLNEPTILSSTQSRESLCQTLRSDTSSRPSVPLEPNIKVVLPSRMIYSESDEGAAF